MDHEKRADTSRGSLPSTARGGRSTAVMHKLVLPVASIMMLPRASPTPPPNPVTHTPHAQPEAVCAPPSPESSESVQGVHPLALAVTHQNNPGATHGWLWVVGTWRERLHHMHSFELLPTCNPRPCLSFRARTPAHNCSAPYHSARARSSCGRQMVPS